MRVTFVQTLSRRHVTLLSHHMTYMFHLENTSMTSWKKRNSLGMLWLNTVMKLATGCTMGGTQWCILLYIKTHILTFQQGRINYFQHPMITEVITQCIFHSPDSLGNCEEQHKMHCNHNRPS